MNGLTEIPKKMSAAEFEDLYNRAISRLRGHERRAVLGSLKAMIRVLIREELAKARPRRGIK